MAWQYRYINRQKESSYVGYSLILEDREAVPALYYRIEKAFKVDENLIDDEFLRNVAYGEIDRINFDLSQVVIVDDTTNQEVDEG